VLPINDAQSGAARVCLILGSSQPTSTASCSPGHDSVPITGLPAHTGSQDVAVAYVGEVNGARYGDIAVSDSAASFDGRAGAGVTWIVGLSAKPRAIDLNKLGRDGFEIGGAAAGDGASVTDERGGPGIGDVNGGGLDSVVLTSTQPQDGAERDPSTAWVVFGRRGTRSVDLAHLAGRGFAIDGPAGGTIEQATIVGDVNGDGLADIGVQDSATLGQDAVVYGSASSAAVDLGLLGRRGFLVTGLASASGGPIAGAGEGNGDGLGDLLVGDPWSGGECGPDSPIEAEICPGTAYLIYGERGNRNVNVQDLGARGYTISSHGTDGLGATVAAVGGGGRPDLLVGDNSHVFVIFPRAGGARTKPINLDRSGFGGFVISFPTGTGIALGPGSGPGLAGVGDLNGDGRGDILVEPATPNGNATDFYVVYGKTSSSAVNLAQLGSAGFQIH